jgi:hypothetical protein
MRIVSKLILKFSKQKSGRSKLEQSVQKRTPALLGFQNGQGSPLFNLDQINVVSERNNVLWSSGFSTTQTVAAYPCIVLESRNLADINKGEPYVRGLAALPSTSSPS